MDGPLPGVPVDPGNRGGGDQTEAPRRMSTVAAVKGPAAGQTFTLLKVTIVGRSMDAGIRVDDLTLSREHARFMVDERGEVICEDLRSGNGTFVNGTRIDSVRLNDGDTIVVGESVLVYHADPTAGKETPDDVGQMTMLSFDAPESDSSVINTLDVDSATGGDKATNESTVEELHSANQRLHILYEMFQSFGTSLKEDDLLDKILETLFRIFPATQRGFIILRDPQTEELVPRATRIAGSTDDNRVNISRTLLQFVMEKKQAVLTRDAMEDDRFSGSDSIMDMGMRSVMCAPLLNDERVIGFLTVDTQEVTGSYDQDGLALLAGIASQAGLAITNARMHSELLNQERINQDLANARRIQHSFLPQSYPDVSGYEFADWYVAAQDVGGDFYDFIVTPSGKLCVAVGDVSGKGIPAALMMAKTASHVRFQSGAGIGPAKMLKEINKAIAESDTELFVTLLIMLLDTETHEITVANAGHLSPIVRHADGTVETVECEGGFPIGLVEDAEFPETVMDIGAGDRVCLFTDGVTEAMDAGKEQYGEDELAAAIQGASANASDIIRAVQESMTQHVKDAHQSDDVTFVCFGPLSTDAAPLLILPDE